MAVESTIKLGTVFESKVDNIIADIEKLRLKFIELNKGTSGFEKKLRSIAKSTDIFAKAQGALKTPIKAATDTLSGYDKAMDRMVQSGKKYTEAFKGIASQLSKTEASIKKLSEASEKATESFKKFATAPKKSMKEQEGSVNRLAVAWKGLVEKIKQVAGYSLAATVIYKLTEALRAGVTEVIAFDQALRNLAAISGATAAEVSAMGDRIKDIASRTRFSTGEMSEGMVMLEQSGFNASESMKTINSIALLATATLSEMQVTTDLLTSTIRAFGLQAQEASVVSDVMANAINKSKLTVDKLRIALNYIGVSAKQAGIGLDETAASMMLLAENGLRASTIGTGFRQVISKLLAPNEKLAAAYMAQGLSLEALNPKIVGYQTAIKNLTGVLWDFETGSVNMSKAYAFFGLRGAQTAAVLVKSFAGPVDKFTKMLEIVRRVGTTAEMAEIQAKGLGVELKNLADVSKLVMVAMGEAGLAGVLHLGIEALRLLSLAAVAFFEHGTGKWAVKVTGLVAALAILNVAFKKLAATSVVMSLALGAQSPVVDALRSGWSKLWKVIANHPILAAIGVMAAFALIINEVNKSVEEQILQLDKVAVKLREVTDTLSYYNEALSALSEAGDTEKYAAVIKRFVLENKELADQIAALAGVVDLTTVSFEKFANVLGEINFDKFTAEAETSVAKLNRVAKLAEEAAAVVRRVSAAQESGDTVGSLAISVEDYMSVQQAQDKAAKAALELRKSLSDTIKIVVKMSSSLKMSDEELKEFIQTLSLADPEMAGRIFQEVTNEIDKMNESIKAGIQKYSSSLQALPRGFQTFYANLTALEKANFIEFSASLNRRISVYDQNARLMNLSDQDRASGKAAIRAEALQSFMRNNDAQLGSVEEREAAILGVIESYRDAALSEYRKGVATRVETEGKITSFITVINAKYLEGIKKTYKAAEAVVGKYVKNLESKLKEAQGRIDSVNAAMVDANESLYQDLRDLRQQTMSDEQKWYGDRAEASRLLHEGMKSGNMGMLRDSQSLYKSLSRVVKDENGKVVMDIAQTREEAAKGIQDAHKATTDILKGQEKAAREQFGKIKSEIDKAKEYLESYRLKIQEVSREPLTLNTSELGKIFSTLGSDLDKFKSRLAAGAEYNVAFTGTGSDKKLITEKVDEVVEKIGTAGKKISDTKAVLKIDIDDSVFTGIEVAKLSESFASDFSRFVGESVDVAKEGAGKIVSGIKSTYSRLLGVRNIFELVFLGEGDDEPLAVKAEKLVGTFENISKNISTLRTRFDILYNGGSVEGVSTETSNLIAAFDRAAATIGTIKSAFEIQFTTDKGDNPEDFVTGLMYQLVDLSESVGGMQTSFLTIFDTDTGTPLDTRLGDIAYQTEKAAKAIGGLGATFTTDFLSSDGLVMTDAISNASNSVLGLSKLIDDTTSTLTVAIAGPKGESIEKEVGEAVHAIKTAEDIIDGTDAVMAIKAEGPDKDKSILGWLGDVVKDFAKASKFMTGMRSVFSISFLSDDGIPFKEKMGFLKAKLENMSKYVSGIVTDFQIGIKSGDISVEKTIGWVKKKFNSFKSFIKELDVSLGINFFSNGKPTDKAVDSLWVKIKSFAESVKKLFMGFVVKFFGEEAGKDVEVLWIKLETFAKNVKGLFSNFRVKLFGKNKPGEEVDSLWVKLKIFAKNVKKLAVDFVVKFFGEASAKEPLGDKISGMWDLVKSFSTFIGGMLTEFMIAFTDGQGGSISKAFDAVQSQGKKISSTINGTKTLFKVFVTDKDGMSLTEKIKATVGSVEKARDTINGVKAAFTVALSANKAGLTSEKISEKLGISIPAGVDFMLSAINKARDTINRMKTAFNVMFTGEGSSKKPLTEKIEELETVTAGFNKEVSAGAEHVTGFQGEDGLPFLTSVAAKVRGMFQLTTWAERAAQGIKLVGGAAHWLKGVAVGAFTRILPLVTKFTALAKFFPAISKSLGFIATKFNVVGAAVGAFFAGWDIGQVINDMDLFGSLPMKMKNYFQQAMGFMDLFVTRAKASFAKFGEVASNIPGLGFLSNFFTETRVSAEKEIDQINRTIQSIAPPNVELDDKKAVNSAVKVKRAIETVLADTYSYFKIMFTGEGSSEKPIMDKLSEITSGFDNMYGLAEKGVESVTKFVGDNGKGVKSFVDSMLERANLRAQESRSIDKTVAAEKAKFKNMFNIRDAGAVLTTKEITQSMYNEWQGFYVGLDSLRKVDFKKFWESTKAEVDAYETSIEGMNESQEERIRTIAEIRKDAFTDFKKAAQEGMLAHLDKELDKVVEQIGKATERLDEESAKRLKIYDSQIHDIEMAQIEAERVLAEKTSITPNKVLIDSFNNSLGVLSDLSEKEQQILETGHRKKADLYLASLSADERYALSKGEVVGRLKQSVGMLSNLSVAEQAALEEGSRQKAGAYLRSLTADEQYVMGRQAALGKLNQSVGILSEMSEKEIAIIEDKHRRLASIAVEAPNAEVEAILSAADKIKLIEIQKSEERIATIRQRLGIAVSAMETFEAQAVGVVEQGEAKKTAARVKGLSATEKLDAEFAIEKEKFWKLNADLAAKRGIDMLQLEKNASNARAELLKGELDIVRKNETEKTTLQKAGFSEREKLDAQLVVERDKFWKLNVDLARKRGIDVVKLEKDASEAKKALAADEITVITNVAAKKLQKESVVSSRIEAINKKLAGKKKEFYKEAREALEAELGKSLDLEKQVASEILDLTKSLADERTDAAEKEREMRRGLMTDEAAYADEVAAVQEKINEAYKRMKTSPEEAAKLFKEAKSAAEALNKVVGEGADEEAKKAAAFATSKKFMDAAMTGLGKATESQVKALAQVQVENKKNIDITKETLNVVNSELDKFTKKAENVKIAVDEEAMSNIKKQVKDLTQEIENRKVLNLDISKAEKDIDRLIQKMKKLEKGRKSGASPGDDGIKMAGGGVVPGGLHPPGIDTVPANLTIGEVVSPVSTARKYTYGFLEGLRQKAFPVENIMAVLRAGRRRMSDMQTGVRNFFDGGVAMRTPTIRPVDNSFINRSMVQYFQAGGVARPAQAAGQMPNLGRFELNVNGAELPGQAEPDVYKAFVAKIKQNNRRRMK